MSEAIDNPVSLSRRTLIRSAAGGGLLLSFPWALEPGGLDAKAAPRFAPDAFIRIDTDDQITFVMPQQEMGQGIYTALSQLLADELDAPLSRVQVEAAPPNAKLYAAPGSWGQSTGGSTSIKNFYMHLRKAGAAARAVLVQAAANTWKVPVASLRTSDGFVYHDASKRRISYGALAGRAAGLKPPADPVLKAPKDFKLIGKSVKRIDTPDKVRGAAVYGIDVQLPGLKTATMMACPVVGGKVRRVDDSRAKTMPGVRQIVVLDDMVAVVADHFWAAKQGLAALTVEWNEGPNASINSDRIWRELRAASRRKKGVPAGEEGNVDKALTIGERIEAAYELPFLAHAPMEPLNCTVHYTPGRCEVWGGTQTQVNAQNATAKAVGLPPEKVILHNYMLGGGFGRRLDVDMMEKAARIAKEVKGPVKVIWTREEDMRHDMYRPAYINVMSASVDKGKIQGWTHRVAGGTISPRMSGRPLKDGLDRGALEGAIELPYAIANRRADYVQAEPRALNLGYWRGVGPNSTIFAVESFMDEVALKAGKDPVDFRLSMITEPRLRHVLQLAAQKAGWGGALPKRVGRGVAVHDVFGSYVATIAEVEVDETGRVNVRRFVSAIDAGAVVNPDTVRAQLEGGLLFGLTAVLYGEITVDKGRVQQTNFNNYRPLRITEAPPVEVHIVTNNLASGGVGEPGTTAAAPSVANAIAAATGVRLRTLPIDRELLAGRKRA